MERKQSIDFLRIISAMAVVVIHTVSSPVSNYGGELSSGLINTLRCIHNLMNWAVPVFFMITGYCILRKKEYTYKQCLPHIAKYIAVLFTVGLAYALMEEAYASKAINLSALLKSLQNVISGNLWDHMWYVYSIIGIYLVLPVIHPFMQSGKRNCTILTGLLFLFTILLPSAQQWFVIGVDFPFGGYLFYVCFGGMLAQCDIGKKDKIYAAVLGLTAIMCIVLNSGQDSFGYLSLPVCLIAGSIFVVISTINIPHSTHILLLSQCTWGVYLIHPLFINIAIKVLKIDLLSHMPYVKLFVFWLALCLISFATTYAIKKIPVIKNYSDKPIKRS